MGNRSATRLRRVVSSGQNSKNEEQRPCSQYSNSEADSSDYESDGEWDNLPEFPELTHPNSGYVRSIPYTYITK